MLNLVGAIDEPTQGRIQVGTYDLTSLDQDDQVRYRRESVGFVCQFFNLIPTLTAAENVELVADLTGVDGAMRSHDVLAKVGLDKLPLAFHSDHESEVHSAARAVRDGEQIIALGMNPDGHRAQLHSTASQAERPLERYPSP